MEQANGARQPRRLVGAVAVSVSVFAWWPAFTLGAWHQVFFTQVLALWAAATASFIVVLLRSRAVAIRRWMAAALLLPSLWIALAFAFGHEQGARGQAVFWTGAVITVLGIPLMGWVLLLVALPDVRELVSRRDRFAAAVAVLVVVAGAFALGEANARFLSCQDFAVSGNSLPPGCNQGTGSLQMPGDD